VGQLKCLDNLVILDNGNLFRGKDYDMFFGCMIQVAGHTVDEELRYQAGKVIRDIHTKNICDKHT
jgi:hypothetical protein